MKRLLVSTALCLTLAVSKPALAADLTGLYVAPKFSASEQKTGEYEEKDNYSGSMLPVRDTQGSKTDTAWGGALAIGYDFHPALSLPIRAELEYAARSQARTSFSGTSSAYGFAATNTRKTEVSSLFANVFYDFHNDTKFTPYVGAGVGVAQIRVKDNFWTSYGAVSTGSGSKTVENFAWNLGAGVAYSFDSNWKLDLGYRYSDFGSVTGAAAVDGYSFTHQAKSRATSHEVMMGLRYGF